MRIFLIPAILLLCLAALQTLAHADTELSNQYNKQTQDNSNSDVFLLQLEDIQRLPKLETSRKRKAWWPSERETINKWEATPVYLEGFVYSVSGAEEFWNGPKDLVILLGSYPIPTNTALTLRCYINSGILEEKTSWTRTRIRELKGLQVRIYGYLVWDNHVTRDWTLRITRITYKDNNLFKEL